MWQSLGGEGDQAVSLKNGGGVIVEESTIEIIKREIREQINVLHALVDQLPESKDEALAQLDALEKKIRVMQEEQSPLEPEDEPYIGT